MLRVIEDLVEGTQLLAKLSHYLRHHRIDAAKKIVPRNTTFEVEQIEQLALIDVLPPHNDRLRCREPQADGITIRRPQRGTFSTASTHLGSERVHRSRAEVEAIACPFAPGRRGSAP